MSKSRLVLMVDPEIHAALRVEAGLADADMSELVSRLVREHFPDAVRQVQERRKKEKKRPGRDADGQ